MELCLTLAEVDTRAVLGSLSLPTKVIKVLSVIFYRIALRLHDDPRIGGYHNLSGMAFFLELRLFLSEECLSRGQLLVGRLLAVVNE